MTSTSTVQVAPAKTEPKLKLKELLKGTAVTAGVPTPPLQFVVAFGCDAISNPEGSELENIKKLAVEPLIVLSIVYCKVLVELGVIVAGENKALNPGLAESTVNVALAVPELPALLVSALEVFKCTPAVALVTSTEKVQLSFKPKR